jgi:hypothetical protein
MSGLLQDGKVSLAPERKIQVRYKSARLGVCLLALCRAASEPGVHLNAQVAASNFQLFDERGDVQPTGAGLASGVQRHSLSQVPDWRALISGRANADSDSALAGNLSNAPGGKTNWSNSPNNASINSYIANDAVISRTAGILCANYNLCIEYNPPTGGAAANWLANVAPVDGGYVGPSQFGTNFGGTGYRSAAAASNSTPAGSPYPANIDSGDLTPAAPSPATSNALDQGAEFVQSAAALTDAHNGILAVSAMGAVSDYYQGANSRALTDSISSDDHFDQSDPLHLEGGSDAPRVTPPVIQHAAQPGSKSSGYNSTPIVDSELQAAGNQVVNQSAASVNWWPVVPFGPTWDAPQSNPWPPEFRDPGPMYPFPSGSSTPSTSATDPPNQGASNSGLDLASPVPEPSQLVLMFTVIALTVLAAKRSAFRRRSAAQPGISTS